MDLPGIKTTPGRYILIYTPRVITTSSPVLCCTLISQELEIAQGFNQVVLDKRIFGQIVVGSSLEGLLCAAGFILVGEQNDWNVGRYRVRFEGMAEMVAIDTWDVINIW